MENYTTEIFSITDRYGSTDKFMVQALPDQKPFYYVMKMEYKKVPCNTASTDIDEIISYYQNNLLPENRVNPTGDNEIVKEIYAYFLDLEQQFLQKLMDYKTTISYGK